MKTLCCFSSLFPRAARKTVVDGFASPFIHGVLFRQWTDLTLMKVLTFLAFVWAGIVIFGELQKQPGGPSSLGSNVFRPVASVITTAPARPVTVQTSAPPSSSFAAIPASSSAAVSSTVDFVKQKLSTISGGSSFSIPSAMKGSSRGELRIARGIVVGQDGPNLILNCSGWIVQSIHGYIYAGDGVGMDPMAANLVEAHEQFRFGRLLAVNQGTVRESFSLYDRATWSTGSYLSGPVLVKGYPSPVSNGKGMKVVVAPDGTGTWLGNSIPAYTASFTLSD